MSASFRYSPQADFDGTQRDHAGVDVFDGASAM
jgi:hypothetical protein